MVRRILRLSKCGGKHSLNIQEEIKYIEEDSMNPFERAVAFTKVVNYCEEKLKDVIPLAHDMLMRVHLKKSGENYFLFECTKDGLEFSRSRDLTSQEMAKMIELLQVMKEKREKEERESEELKKRVLARGDVC